MTPDRRTGTASAPVTPTPLFTRPELAAAFALVLPPALATSLAARWFEEFADDVRPDGWFVHFDRWAPPRQGPDEPVRAEDRDAWDAPHVVAGDEATFRGLTDDTAADWFLRLGDLHLAMVAVLNGETFERMRQVRGATTRQAERSRLQLTRAVRAYRSSRGWPPAI